MTKSKEYYRGIDLLGNVLGNAKALNFVIDQIAPAELSTLLALTDANVDAVARNHNRFVVVSGAGGRVLHQLVASAGVLSAIKYVSLDQVNTLIASAQANSNSTQSALAGTVSGIATTLASLISEVGAISMGQPTLTNQVLSLPFTKADGTVVTRTVDLSSLGVDVQVVSASLDANTYSLTITESNGDTNTVNLKAVIEKVFNEEITGLQANVSTIDNRVSALVVAADAGFFKARGEINLTGNISVDALIYAIDNATAPGQYVVLTNQGPMPLGLMNGYGEFRLVSLGNGVQLALYDDGNTILFRYDASMDFARLVTGDEVALTLKLSQSPVNITVGVTIIAPEASKTSDVLFSRINAQGREVQCEFDWFRENDMIKVESSVAVPGVLVRVVHHN